MTLKPMVHATAEEPLNPPMDATHLGPTWRGGQRASMEYSIRKTKGLRRDSRVRVAGNKVVGWTWGLGRSHICASPGELEDLIRDTSFRLD